ncbi:MAG: threonine--tRNA ligase [Ignavibacteriaceae bacterium]
MENIIITFPDGNSKSFVAGTSAMEIARSISPRLAESALVASLDDKLVDLASLVYQNASIKFFTFDDSNGKETYWHSTSHLMAHAITELYPEATFGVGPAIESGFYYDIDINHKLSEENLTAIEEKMIQLANQANPFNRVVLPKPEAIDFFKKVGDKYKLEILSDLPEDAIISLYKEGSFTDLCTGPHIPDTSKIKFVKLLSVSGSYWRGDEKNKQLQRIYGISFPKKKMLDDYLAFLEEAKKRDHRKIGKALDLFSIHDEAGAGLIYWHPKGAMVRYIIEEFWRQEHLKNGYELLFSPHMGKSWLWETSGHLVNYKENMYAKMSVDDNDYYIKPMNCPFHILIYKNKLHSYRDLPLRWAELGTVYRYEKSGVLHGLLRVRGFTQDDAHIFCTPDQIEEEIMRTVRFSKFMLTSFGFSDMAFYISTKPEKAIESHDEKWEMATQSLINALERENTPYTLDEGGGAFYGPKIDIKIKDALNREWQLSTIQFDFNLPERFDLTFIGEDGKEHRPYMVHRALLGSIERFFGVLIEHYAGAFPLWLSPVQVAIIPVSQNFSEYAETVNNILVQNNIRSQVDKRNEKIGFKIRDWESQKTPYMIIVGEKEMNSSSISVRKHKAGDIGSFSTSDFIETLKNEINNKS